MTVAETAKKIINEQGRKQNWVAARMREIAPETSMNHTKLSAILTGIQTMTADELLAFCKAVEVSPDVFLEAKDFAKE